MVVSPRLDLLSRSFLG
uniref:Uncharacterized protein n=1 Tax=Arundo donax TaxID=35708 RepID=A0A0A9ERT2_ARUDO